jgi:hypothetical protein
MPIVLDRQQIDAALPKVAPGLAKYLRIMEFVATDPAFHDDPEFRRAFNGFYRVRRSAQTWQPHSRKSNCAPIVDSAKVNERTTGVNIDSPPEVVA